MDKIKYWLNWIAVFPGAIVAGLLSTFLFHWVLYETLANGLVISGVDINPIESILYPFVVAIVFILAGYKIAPDHKFKASITLFIIYVIAWIIFSAVALLGGSSVSFQLSGSTILALVGAAFGLYITKMIDKK